MPARARALAGALAGDGYAASAGTTPGGAVQLCQGHCPVHAVAARYPELCDAEAEAFARAQGCRHMMIGVLSGNSRTERIYLRAGFRPYAVEMIREVSPE